MPTLATSKWPKPKSEDEWEDMVLDALKIFWNDPDAHRNGRKGQSQNGIDIFGQNKNGLIGAQVKNMTTISRTTINNTISGVFCSDENINGLYFVISGDRDTKLQKIVREISQKQLSKNSFPIHILFFEDIAQELSKEKNLILKYWSDFLKSATSILTKKSITTSDAAYEAITSTKEFDGFCEKIFSLSKGQVGVSLRIEHIPKLDSEVGSIDRSWQIAIAESHETHLVTLIRIAIDVDDGSIKVYDLPEDEWVSQNEWINRGHSIFGY